MGFYKFSPKLFPEKNIVSIEKTENILNSWDFLKEKKPEKIISKAIFLKENIVLTVAHWVDSFEDEYKIFSSENIFSKAKLLSKDENDDFAILQTNDNFLAFQKIAFWELSEKKELYYFYENNFKKVKIEKNDEKKIYVKEIFEPGDSGTIFFNEKKEIVGILVEYDLKNWLWIINIIDENILKIKNT